MKKLGILSLLFVMISSFSMSQIAHDLEIFSETNDKFKVYINGVELSSQYGKHVRLDNVQNDNLNVKIEFEDKSKAPIVKKYLLLSDPGEGQDSGPASPCSNVYKVKMTKKGKMKLAFVSRSKKKIQQVVHQTTVINNNSTVVQGSGTQTRTSGNGGSVTVNTPVGGISLTIFD